MSYVIDLDIYDSSVPCMDDGCYRFRAGKQSEASCLHEVHCRLNPNSKPSTPKPKT